MSSSACNHQSSIKPVTPSGEGCAECLATGDTWVQLRICRECGHVGCCDSSKNAHASKHYEETKHPVMQSLSKGEEWLWCYPDKTYIDLV